MEFHISPSKRGKRPKYGYIQVSGRLDTAAAPKFNQALIELSDELDFIAVDMEKLEYLCSAGVRALKAILSKLERRSKGRKHWLYLLHVPRKIKEFLSQQGYDELFKIVDELPAE